MMIRTHRITTIVLIASMCAFLLCSDLSATFGSVFFYVPVAATLVAAGMAFYNAGAVRSDNPSKFGGLFGTVWGAPVAVYGGVLLSSRDSAFMTLGSCITAAGITSVYYGIKSLARVRGKYLESKKLGISIDPVILNRDCRKTEVGIQISYTF